MSATLVLLVDGDNVNPGRMDDILSDVRERGDLKVFRIYADFSAPQASAWRDVVESRPAEAIQVYSSRPQAVDLAMSLDRRFSRRLLLGSPSMWSTCVCADPTAPNVARRYSQCFSIFLTPNGMSNSMGDT